MSEPLNYTPKTDEEIKQLAMDTFAGRIFWGPMAGPGEMCSPFMVLMLMEPEQLKPLADAGMVPYEYMDKASPISVNGHPRFFSCRFVTATDYNRVVAKYKAICEAVEKA